MVLALCNLFIQGLDLIPELLVLFPKLFNHLKFDRSLKIIIPAQAISSTFTLIEPFVFSQLLTWYPTIFLLLSLLVTIPSQRIMLSSFLIEPLMFFRLLTWHLMVPTRPPFSQPPCHRSVFPFHRSPHPACWWHWRTGQTPCAQVIVDLRPARLDVDGCLELLLRVSPKFLWAFIQLNKSRRS